MERFSVCLDHFCLDWEGKFQVPCIFNIALKCEEYNTLNVSLAHSLLTVVYFYSLECFGCYARAHKAWKTETVPLKRQILDAPPKAPPLPTLNSFSASPLSLTCFCLSHVAASFIFSLFRLNPLAKLLFWPLPHPGVLLSSLKHNHQYVLQTPLQLTSNPVFSFFQSLPFVYFLVKVWDMSSDCRQCLQEAPLLVLHAMKLSPFNKLWCCQKSKCCIWKIWQTIGGLQTERLSTAY